MSLQLCVLASGSSGNCIYVGSASTRLLIDAGLSCRQIEKRLADIDVSLASISGVCVTHEHSDHTGALRVLQRRFSTPLYANRGTVEAIGNSAGEDLAWKIFTTGQPFLVGDCIVTPFSVPHDSYDPVGFIVRCGEVQVGIVTDAGIGTALMQERLRNSDIIVIEANHDEDLLRDAKRPWSLKQRIAGRQGHLSNAQAAALLCGTVGANTHTVFLCHLSADCNEPATAIRSIERSLRDNGHARIKVAMTYADRATDLIVV